MVESRSDTLPEWSLQGALCGKRNREYDMASVDGDFFGYPRLDGLQYILCHIENKLSVN
jgi:hypothetical protein